MKRSALILVLLLLALALPASALAAEGTLSPEALEIANSLNCPVCMGESVRDSNADVARQMRQLIQQQVDQGQTPDQIRAYFVERYGQSILREPPKQGFALTLWWVPVIGVAIGSLILVTFVLQRRERDGSDDRADSAGEDNELQQYEEQLRRQLGNLDRGV